jgi:hypothetical protein
LSAEVWLVASGIAGTIEKNILAAAEIIVIKAISPKLGFTPS